MTEPISGDVVRHSTMPTAGTPTTSRTGRFPASVPGRSANLIPSLVRWASSWVL